MRPALSLLLCYLSLTTFAPAQTCCGGGVPVSSNLGLPAGEAQLLQFSLSYDLNVLKTLKAGTRQLDDQSRNRKTHSILFEMGYGFTDRFAIDGFFSLVRQERTVRQFGHENFSYSQGLGDAVVLFKYRLLSTPDLSSQLHAALGVKAPLGATDLTDRESGIRLNADLQPGSGAWDGLLWAQYTQITGFRPSMRFIATATYSAKGKNKTYLVSQVYQFGNEWQLMMGLSDRWLVGAALIDPALQFRYRTVLHDRNNRAILPSTGGDWIFVIPSLSFWLSPDLSFNINGELPLFARLEGTQVTPTYRINLGFFYRLSIRPEQITF